MKQKNRALAMFNLAIILAVIGTVPAQAGFGNLFGNSGSNNNADPPGGGAVSPLTPPGAIGAIDADDGSSRQSTKKGSSGSDKIGSGNPPPSDYTDDEKRMQGRYQTDLTNARRTIIKGERLMKSAGSNVNSKNYKKGLIYKEIGEKDLKRLKDNTPFPAQNSLDDKANRKKPDSL